MKTKHAPLFILPAALLTLLHPAEIKAQIPVTDVAHMAQNQVSDAMAYVQYVREVANGYQQIAHQVTQIQNQMTELERMGDLKSLLELAGVDGILAELEAGKRGFKTMEAYFENLTGEAALEYEGLGNITGIGPVFRIGEEEVARDPGRYREAEGVYRAVGNYRRTETGVAERRAALLEEIAGTVTRIEGAKDEAEVMKYSNVLQGQRAALEALSGETDMAKAQVDVTAAEALVSREARKEAEAEKEAALMNRANQKDVETYRIDSKPASFKGFPGVE